MKFNIFEYCVNIGQQYLFVNIHFWGVNYCTCHSLIHTSLFIDDLLTNGLILGALILMSEAYLPPLVLAEFILLRSEPQLKAPMAGAICEPSRGGGTVEACWSCH